VDAVAYYRVSTDSQGADGYGMEAQQLAVAALLERKGHTLIGEFTEVESGRVQSRPQLAEALAQARAQKAVLVVAKLDRLGRDVELISGLVKEARRNGFGGLLFADFPDVDPRTDEGKLFIHQMAAFAEFEAGRISQRTKAGLAVAKARGVKLGGLRGGTKKANAARRQKATADAERLRPLLTSLQSQGATLQSMASALEKAGVKTSGGRDSWAPMQVKRALDRLGLN